MRASSARVLAAAAVLLALGAAACSAPGGGAGPRPGRRRTVRVLMVDNPQMVDLQRLTAEHFTQQTGIEVEYTLLPENDVREQISQEFSSQAGRYDVASVSNFEVPFYARNGWLAPLDAVTGDAAFNQSDILQPMAQGLTGEDGKVYGEPFYGESSFLMYRKDVFAAKGLTMPDRPTWQQVADLAAKVDGAQPGMKGICLRGLPGWGEVMAPLTTVVNTFGGTWFTRDWQAELDAPEFVAATTFYVDLVRAHGEPDAFRAGFADCLDDMQESRAAMWYDATSAAGSLEVATSPVAGKVGYAPAPVVRTASSGWLYSWAWGIQQASRHHDDAAAFIAWASSKRYEELVGRQLGWARVPAGKRASTYANADYLAAAGAFAAQTHLAITAADPRNPGVQPRPTVGIQFVGIPEFTALGTMVSQEVSDAIAGRQTVAGALQRGQRTAEQVAQRHQGR